MDTHTAALVLSTVASHGGRQHRFMESADINAAFREMFGPLRASVRRGMSVAGQIYTLEMDACLPGEVLGADWIPLATRGFEDAAELADEACRVALFEQVLAERRPEALVAWVCERMARGGQPVLHVELASVDGRYAAAYPVTPGSGWHVRELLMAPHQRLERRTPA